MNTNYTSYKGRIKKSEVMDNGACWESQLELLPWISSAVSKRWLVMKCVHTIHVFPKVPYSQYLTIT